MTAVMKVEIVAIVTETMEAADARDPLIDREGNMR